MNTKVIDVQELINDGSKVPAGWKSWAVVNDDNMTYVVVNEKTQEGIVVDPMREDWDALVKTTDRCKGYRWVAVIDTHTHADHVSNAARLAEYLGAPLVQHAHAPSKRIHLKVGRDTAIHTQG
jgi:glyoxylase-like metal-dependent hydrolase (beta-lactamase superfamily II)